MNDDFRLFGDDDPGEAPIDADVALITAYLARELSPMQVLAVEERLVSDGEFRTAMQPLIDAWAAPVASLAGSAGHPAPLTAQEKSASWDRFQKLDPGAVSIAPDTKRRMPMKRVAAIVGLTALPVLSFAQAVTYAARHENAPGHAIAARLVAVFSAQPSVPGAVVEAPKVVQDIPIGTVLSPTPAEIQSAPVAVAELLPAPSNPDRAHVASLVRQYQPRVVRGDTLVEYVVIVVDAADKYLGSTIGSGNLVIDVGADTRTAKERNAYNLQFRDEFIGPQRVIDRIPGADTAASRATRKPLIVVDGIPVADSAAPTRKPPYAIARADSAGAVVLGIGASAAATRKPQDNTIAGWEMNQAVRATPIGDSGRVKYEVAGPYRAGWHFTVYGDRPLNSAAGLQEPGKGESGIQGIRSASVVLADPYMFPKGELAPQFLRVVIVKLTPGTSWGRSY